MYGPCLITHSKHSRKLSLALPRNQIIMLQVKLWSTYPLLYDRFISISPSRYKAVTAFAARAKCERSGERYSLVTEEAAWVKSSLACPPWLFGVCKGECGVNCPVLTLLLFISFRWCNLFQESWKVLWVSQTCTLNQLHASCLDHHGIIPYKQTPSVVLVMDYNISKQFHKYEPTKFTQYRTE